MNRPYIFCHMLTSLDGKIMGNYMDLPACEPAGDLFYDIAFGEDPFYRHQGWLSGRVTTDDNFTHYRAPALTPGAPTVPEGDFVAQQAPMYYVSVDPKGKLGWESATLTYETTTSSRSSPRRPPTATRPSCGSWASPTSWRGRTAWTTPWPWRS